MEAKHPTSPLEFIVTPSLEQIPWSSIQLAEHLGTGGFGEVYKATWLGIPVAVKQLHMKHLNPASKKEFEQEAKIMVSCYFPYLVRLYGICTEPSHNSLIMEYVARGSLYEILHNQEELLPWDPMRWQIAIDVGMGLQYLHSKKIIHRDIKSHNIFIDENYRAKIGDFGLAKIRLESTIASTYQIKNTAGSTRWKAPELFKPKTSPNEFSDIYSYGMVMWELTSRQIPFAQTHDDAEVREWLKEGTQEDIPADCPPSFKSIIEDCWNPESKKRPSAQVIVERLQKDFPKLASTTFQTEKSWHFDSAIKASSLEKEKAKEKGYALLSASAKDAEKVAQFYLHHPVPGYDIKSVQIIYNPTMNRGFELKMKMLQERFGNAAFTPKWNQETQSEWRRETDAMWKNMAAPYIDSDYPQVKLLPMWHGTRPEVVTSVLSTGYANLASTDSGYFGKGIYSAYEVEYAYRVYSKGGALIVNWVASFSAYPVIEGDMGKLSEKGNYQNYDAHFIPVVPQDPNDLDETIYYPCKPNQKHTYTEMVVFESSQCLPRYLVELQPTLPKSILSSSASPLEKAADYAYKNYLSKPFTAPGGEDREYSYNGIIIHRPNHGLAHTLRCVFYAPFVVEAYNKHNPGNKLSGEDLERIQIALIFHVAGRLNDMSSADDADLYQRAREESAEAFVNYVKAHMPEKFPEQIREFYAHAIRQLSGYGEQHPITLIINFCHYLDLPRCLSKEICDGICNAYIPYLGIEAIEQLKECAQQLLISTGNRIIEKDNYKGDIFVNTSQDIQACIFAIQRGIQTWEMWKKETANKNILIAARLGFVEKMKIALQNGASIEATESIDDYKDYTPLLYAAHFGNIECVKFLLNQKANVKAVNAYHQGFIYLAAWNGHDEIIKFFADNYLPEFTLQLNAKNDNGRTPLHATAIRADKTLIDTAKLLIDLGAVRTSKDDTGKNPAEFAESRGYAELAEVIREYKNIPEKKVVNIPPTDFFKLPASTQFALKEEVSHVNSQEVVALLRWVAEGHLEEAEKLLQKDSQLVLAKGTVKDLSNRTFENITAFQLAVWYLDTEMWEIILKYLDKAEAAKQLSELENDRDDIHQKYGKYFDFDPLLKAYRTYNEHRKDWCKNIGGEQCKVPAWYIYALYEKGYDKAWPLKNFTKKVIRKYDEGHTIKWYTAKDGRILGKQYACLRGRNLEVMQSDIGHGWTVGDTVNKERACAHDMFITENLKLSHELELIMLSENLGQKTNIDYVNSKVVVALLKRVTEGHLEEVEKILKIIPRLAVIKGTVKDLSGRVFENITAFQLAVWYLDNEMWEIILKYLDKDEAAKQLSELENNRKDIYQKYGKYFDFEPLLNAYQTYLDNFKKWGVARLAEHWSKKVGGEQRRVPAWLVYALCEEGADKAWAKNDFTLCVRRNYEEISLSEWNTAEFFGGVLGDKFAYGRGDRSKYGASDDGILDYSLKVMLAEIPQDFTNLRILKSQKVERLAHLHSSLQGSQILTPQNISTATSQFFTSVSTVPTVNPQEAHELLKWVAEGHLENVEKLLQKNSQLALEKGTVKDLSGRTFENVTAFQLAVWYLDYEMWEIILKYLDMSEAAKQLNELEKSRKDIYEKYGKHFDFDPLLKAYQAHIDNILSEAKQYWCKKVGTEQRKVPAWFIYAFCEKGEDKAWPKKDFTKKVTREYAEDHITKWYTEKYNGGLLSSKFAWGRWKSGECLRSAHFYQPHHRINYIEWLSILQTPPLHDRLNSLLLELSHTEKLENLQKNLQEFIKDEKSLGVGLKK